MNTLLIVEDEKMIRQGIRAMVQRSGVPVQIILECSNGEKAWDILCSQDVDVVFTDIRMPKMNGIQLVQKMQSLSHIPLTVAISGYDDFSYAVEMMRSGVKDYLLKPIDRTKFVHLMHQLEDELQESLEAEEKSRQVIRQQLRYLLLDKLLPGEELAADADSPEGRILFDSYRVYCVPDSQMMNDVNETQEESESSLEGSIVLPHIGGADVYIASAAIDEAMQEHFAASIHGSIGCSARHSGIAELRIAYREASVQRSAAWQEDCGLKYFDKDTYRSTPDTLREEALHQISPEVRLVRVQLLGTNHSDKLSESMRGLFHAAGSRRISAEEFETAQNQFFDEVVRTYRNILGDEASDNMKTLRKLRSIWQYDSLTAYRTAFMEWLLALQEQIQAVNQLSGSEQKMRRAVEYIRAHYAEDLNMAVVSNELSMNYSQFSSSFKQYTGENFVGFLRNVRMEKARQLLAETDMYIHEIAEAVGYENDKHFMKVFRASCGVSPSEYRRNAEMGKTET